jgi:hypothetical protein
MSQKAPTLQSTKDYSRFELCQFNRSVEKKKHLLESMRKYGYIPAYPLHCTKGDGNRLQIKGGHHRFECAQELGIAVYFVVSNDDASIHVLEEATTRWSIKDYLESFARCGLGDYAKVKEYHEKTGIPIGLCISMLGGEAAGSSNLVAKFKQGKFVVKDELHAATVADVVAHCAEHGIKAVDSIFVQSLSRCLFCSEFSPDIFKVRAANNSSLFKPSRSIVEQTAIFETVYNMKARTENKVPLAFLTNRAMAARNVFNKQAVTA